MKRAAVLALVAACGAPRGAGRPSCPQDTAVALGLQEEVVQIAGCRRIASLSIRTGAPLDLAPLRELEEITGDLSVGPTTSLDEVTLGGLRRVGGEIAVANNGSLRGIFLPSMERVGALRVENNAVMTTVSLPRLASVDGGLVIADNGALELVSAPVLAVVGDEVVIAGHRELSLLEMSQLTRVQAIRIESNPKLAAEVVEQLTRKSASGGSPSP